MILALLLLLIGLALIFLEFYFPGAVIGTGGAVMVIASVVVFAQAAGSVGGVLAYLLVVVLAIYGVVRFTLYRIRKTAKEGTIYLESDQTGYQASHFDASLVGKEGVASSVLKPSGHVVIAGKNYQAVLEAGYVAKGTPVTVIGGRGAYLIVKPVKKEKGS